MKAVVVFALVIGCFALANAGSYYNAVAGHANGLVTRAIGHQTLAVANRLKSPQTKSAMLQVRNAFGDIAKKQMCIYARFILLWLEEMTQNMDVTAVKCFEQEIYMTMVNWCKEVNRDILDDRAEEPNYCEKLRKDLGLYGSSSTTPKTIG